MRTAILLSLALPTFALAQEPVILKHDGWVAAVAFSPDGKTLASAGADNVVRLWEVGTWKSKGVLKGHTDCVCALAFGEESKTLATGGFDRTAALWDLDKQEKFKTFNGHKGAVLTLAIDHVTGLVFSGCVDGTIGILELTEQSNVPIHKSWINSLAFDPKNSKRLASGSSDGTVSFVIDRSRTYLEGGAGEVRCVAFSPNGKLLAAGNRYHTVRVWDVESKKAIRTLDGLMSDVWSIAFSPDGKTLAVADTDWKKPSKVKLWDTKTWKQRYGALDVPGEILSIAYSPNGDWLAVGSWDKTVRVFRVKN